MPPSRNPHYVEILRVRSYDYGGLPGGLAIPYSSIADRVDVVAYRAAVFAVRIHAIEMSAIPKEIQAVELALMGDAFTPSDPARTFFGPAHVTITLTQGNVSGSSVIAPVAAPLAPFLTLRMAVLTGLNDWQPLKFTISAGLALFERAG